MALIQVVNYSNLPRYIYIYTSTVYMLNLLEYDAWIGAKTKTPLPEKLSFQPSEDDRVWNQRISTSHDVLRVWRWNIWNIHREELRMQTNR